MKIIITAGPEGLKNRTDQAALPRGTKQNLLLPIKPKKLYK